MNRASFWCLVIPLGLAAFVGVLLVVHAAWPKSEPDTLSCEQWFADPPSSGTYRVEGCVVELAEAGWTVDPYGSSQEWMTTIDVVVAPVRLPTADPTAAPSLFVGLRDPDAIAFARRLERDPEGSRELDRTRDRYKARLATVRSFAGSLRTYGEEYRIAASGFHAPDFRYVDASGDEPDFSEVEGAIGITIFVFPLGVLVPLVLVQRRWKSIERSLRARAEGRPDMQARPQTF